MNTAGTNGSICAEAVPMTLSGLIEAYKTDPVSGWRRIRYHSRVNQEGLLRRLVAAYGDRELSSIRARDILAWHQGWCGDENKTAMAHAFMGKLRTIMAYGTVFLENDECTRLCLILNKMRFPGQASRKTYLTAEQVMSICDKARYVGWYSIALAQAIQFELMLRQKDVIGEYVPLSEPGDSDVTDPSKGKWLRGLRWSEIDENMVLRHVTSKRQKELVVDLNMAPMVLAEMQHTIALYGELPKTGPIVLCEATNLPFIASEFRRKWRKVADLAGIPKEICSMDSRAGAVTEATAAGADLESIRHAATHSDIAMTQRYSRAATDKIASVQSKRLAHRKALLAMSNTTRSMDR